MLHLKRVQYFTDFLKCHVSKEIIRHGDYYYEDDVDGFIVKATVYKRMEKEKKENEFDYSKLNMAESMRDYQAQLKEYERQFLEQTLFERKLATDPLYNEVETDLTPGARQEADTDEVDC